MKTGFRAREAAARLLQSRYETSEEIRATRSIPLRQFDLRRVLSAADERVAAAREALRLVDVAALQAELDAALADQTAILEELARLEPAAPSPP